MDTRQRGVAILEVLLCSSLPTQVVIGGLLGAAGLAPTAGGGFSFAFVITLLLADTLVITALMLLVMRAHGESARTLWLGSQPIGREAVRGLLWVPGIAISVGITLNALRLLTPSLHNVTTNPLEQLAATPGQAAALSLTAILAGGVREELQRAFLLRRFEQYLGGAAVGLVVLSVAFGFGHKDQGWDAVVTTGLLGAFWAWVYLRRRSSVAPVVSHAGFNSLEIVRAAMSGR